MYSWDKIVLLIATVGFRNQAYTSCDSRWLYLYFYLYLCLGKEFIYFCHHWYSQTGCCTRNILVIDSHQIYAVPHSLHGTNWVVCKYSPTTSQTVEKYKKNWPNWLSLWDWALVELPHDIYMYVQMVLQPHGNHLPMWLDIDPLVVSGSVRQSSFYSESFWPWRGLCE